MLCYNITLFRWYSKFLGKQRPGWQAKVLNVLRQHGGSLSAYEILAELREDNPKLAPPTIYRTLARATSDRSGLDTQKLDAFATTFAAQDS